MITDNTLIICMAIAFIAGGLYGYAWGRDGRGRDDFDRE